MSSYLQMHNQKLEARSRSIENSEHDKNSGYVRFLEEQVEKAGKRDADLEKLHLKLIDVQAKLDRLMTRDTKADSDQAGCTRLIAKLEERLQSFESVHDKVDQLEKTLTKRHAGTRL